MTVTVKDAAGANVDIDSESLTVDAVAAQVQGVKIILRTSATTGEDAIKALPANAVGQPALPVWANPIQLATYEAVANALASGTLTAATRKDILSLEHAAAATKTVKLRRILVSGYATTSISGSVEFRLFRGTAASTAGTGVTLVSTNPATPAAEVTVKTLPTIVAATGPFRPTLAGFVAATANSIISSNPPVVLYDWQEAGDVQPYTLRAGVLDSLVLSVQSTAALALVLFITVLLTEE